MIGNPTALGNEIIQPLFQRGKQILQRRNSHFRRRRELVDILLPKRVNLIGTEGRRDLRHTVLAVRGKIVHGIVRRCDVRHAVALQQRLHRHILELFIRFCVNPFRAVLVQRLGNPKNLHKFHVRPVIQRISRHFGQNRRVFNELFLVARITCNILLVHTAKPHCAPFVMISRKPQLADIRKPHVCGNLFLIEMTMIIDNRQRLYTLINPLCRLMIQKQPRAEKLFHIKPRYTPRNRRQWAIRRP